MSDEIEQLRQELALARAFGLALWHRVYPAKSPAIEVPRRAPGKIDASSACLGIDPKRRLCETGYVVIDVETTGLDPAVDRVVEIAFVLCPGEGGEPVSWSSLVNPGVAIPADATRVHRIDEAAITQAPTFLEVWREAERRGLTPIASGRDTVIPMAYCATFDRDFVAAELARAGEHGEAQLLANAEWLDPLVIVRDVDKYKSGKKLADACARRNIEIAGGAHRALGDAQAAHILWQQIVPLAWLERDLLHVLRETLLTRIKQDAEHEAYVTRQQRSRGRAA